MARMTKKNEVAQKLDAIVGMLESMDARISALESAKTKVASTKKSTTKAKTKTTKDAPKKSSAKKTAPKSKGVDIMDFEPCKFKGTNNYVWNGVRGYKAMRSAYCYAVQTQGQAKDLAGARKIGVTIDFDKAWNKAKTEFEKKFHYVKAEDRQ